MTILEAAAELRARRVSSVELTTASLVAIGRLNPKLNAFITVCDVTASDAGQVGGGSRNGLRPTRPPPPYRDHVPALTLQNIPFAIKDLFETKGIRTTAGSLFFKDFVPNEDAAVIQKLKAAGVWPVNQQSSIYNP